MKVLGSRPAPAYSDANRPPDWWSGSRKLGLGGELWLGRAGGADIAVATCELLDTSCRVDELLFTGEVRVAGRTDTDLDIISGRAGLVSGAAGADDRRRVVVGMKTGFHKSLLECSNETREANKKDE